MALPTSNTYNFQSISVELLIREAFENIGIFGEFVESQKLDSARRSIDLLMLEWMNKTVNLWTLQIEYMPLILSTGKYLLSNTINDVSDVVQINLRTSNRPLNGTPTSSAGNAAYAFDDNLSTSCNAGADGWIAYNYGMGVTQEINFVGFISAITTNLDCQIQWSNDGNNWFELFDIPTQNYTEDIVYWFDVITPVTSQYYRIVETGGNTLNLIELYFNNNVYDFELSEISREEYFSYPNKSLEGRPSVYYIDRQIDPYLYLWPVPNSYYNCIQVSYKQMIQDAGAYTNTLQIPARFYPALTLGLSWKLAVKFNPQVAQMFKADYEQAFAIATAEDSENTPLRIYGENNYYGY